MEGQQANQEGEASTIPQTPVAQDDECQGLDDKASASSRVKHNVDNEMMKGAPGQSPDAETIGEDADHTGEGVMELEPRKDADYDEGNRRMWGQSETEKHDGFQDLGHRRNTWRPTRAMGRNAIYA